MVDGGGFPKAHEIFDGNRKDSTIVKEMLETLQKRVGTEKRGTVIVYRGMSFEENIKQIKEKNYHYIVAARQPERNKWLDKLEEDRDWQELLRTSSPLNPSQKKSKILIKRAQTEEEVYILCLSGGRKEKDRAIRGKQEKKFLRDIEKLKAHIQNGKLKNEPKIHQAIGRLKERYPRVARYYTIDFDQTLVCEESTEKKEKAEKLDGSYMMRTDRKDMKNEEIFKTYLFLIRVETAFRDMKSPLCERLSSITSSTGQAHIFLCVLAYHLLVFIYTRFFEAKLSYRTDLWNRNRYVWMASDYFKCH